MGEGKRKIHMLKERKIITKKDWNKRETERGVG